MIYIPPTKHFPDGTCCRFWEQDGKVWGQLFDRKGKRVRNRFTYMGPKPASWDKREEA